MGLRGEQKTCHLQAEETLHPARRPAPPGVQA
jgi:hypothetical protein